jgi:hypothetical protein
MVRFVRRCAAVVALLAAVAACVAAVTTEGPSSGASARPAAVRPAAAEPAARPRSTRIWVSVATLRRRPTTGPAWDALVADARKDPGPADVADQDSAHDVRTLAAALVCVRVPHSPFCGKARSGVLAAIGTERGGRWLAVGRNLTAYVIAADLLGLRADRDPMSDGSRVEAWIRGFLTESLAENNTGRPVPLTPFASGSNASAQEGAAYAAVAAYLGDGAALARAWDAFRTYVCAPSAPDRERIDLHRGVDAGWALDDRHPCAINPAGATKVVSAGRHGGGEVRRIDGAIINDMARGGDYQWPPGMTNYPWVGLGGLVPAAVILYRAGYPAFTVADRAALRAMDYLWYLTNATKRSKWFKEKRENEIVQLVNVVYGARFPLERPTGGGRTIGYTDWSHATWPGPRPR